MPSRLLLVLAFVCPHCLCISVPAHEDFRQWDDTSLQGLDFMSDSVLLWHRQYTFEQTFARPPSLNVSSMSNDRNQSRDDPKVHPPLLPLTARDMVSLCIAAIALFLAAGGGIGGGGVLVPVFIIGMHFTTKKAVALSNLTIAGGAAANFVCNLPRRHPSGHRPLIDWDLILVMEPMTIAGAVFGGYLNKLLPVWLTSLLMSVMLLLMSWNLWSKAIKLYRRENGERIVYAMHSLHGSTTLDAPSDPLLAQPLVPSANKQILDSILEDELVLEVSDQDRAAAKRVIMSEHTQVPLLKLGILIALFLWILATDMLQSKVVCGTWRYWVLVLSIVPVVLLLMVWFRSVLMRKARLKAMVGLVREEGDILWTTKSTVFYPAICSLAGVVAGLFGVGGGIVKGPLLLEMGVLPEVAAATSATMILFTTGAASVVYMAFGGIPWDYAGTLIVMGFVITLVGQMLTYSIIHHLGRRSVIIFAMGSLLTIGCAIMWAESIMDVYKALHHGFFHTSSLCD